MPLVLLMVATPNKLVVKDNQDLLDKLKKGKKCILYAESMKGEPIYLRSEIVTCAMYVSEVDLEKAKAEQEEREAKEAERRKGPALTIPRRPN